MLKARPVRLSAFFENRSKAIDTNGKLPFQTIWTSADSNVLREGNAAKTRSP